MEAEHKKEYRRLPNLVLLLLLLLPLFLFGGCSNAEKPIDSGHEMVIRLATDYREGSLGLWQMESFAQAVHEKSGGAIAVQLYKKDEWSTAESFAAYVDAESLEMACLPIKQAIAIQPMYAVYEQPYLFSGLQAVERYITGNPAQEALKQLPRQYHGIGLVANGYQYLVQHETVQTLDYSTVKRMAEIHELDSAMVYDVRAIYELHPLIASQEWWDSLTEQQQIWIQESFLESLKSALVHQQDMAVQRLIESGAAVQQVLPPELGSYTANYLNQREAYFATHSDVITAYWRPVTVEPIIGEGS